MDSKKPKMKLALHGRTSPVYCESKCIQLDKKKLNTNRCICVFCDTPEADHYRVLRTKIQLLCKYKGWNTLMITSARPKEGKTVTTINLALTFAREFGQTVLLVDCDLRFQDVHKKMGFSSDCGLGDYLLNGTPLKDLIVWPGIEKLTVISGGAAIHESAELLDSPKMKKLVAEMKNRYPDRFIFFDLPPLLSGADAAAFAPLVDGIIMVVEATKTPMEDIMASLELIPVEKFLGFALNRAKMSTVPYYYYYRK